MWAYVAVTDPASFADPAAWAIWLGAASAVLIRPDRYVFGTGTVADLLAALPLKLAS